MKVLEPRHIINVDVGRVVLRLLVHLCRIHIVPYTYRFVAGLLIARADPVVLCGDFHPGRKNVSMRILQIYIPFDLACQFTFKLGGAHMKTLDCRYRQIAIVN